MTDEQEERHHTDAEYDELKAKLDATNGLLETASEQAIANGVRMEKAEAELARLKENILEMKGMFNWAHILEFEDAMKWYREDVARKKKEAQK